MLNLRGQKWYIQNFCKSAYHFLTTHIMMQWIVQVICFSTLLHEGQEGGIMLMTLFIQVFTQRKKKVFYHYCLMCHFSIIEIIGEMIINNKMLINVPICLRIFLFFFFFSASEGMFACSLLHFSSGPR